MKRAGIVLGYTFVAVSDVNFTNSQPSKPWIYAPWLDLIVGCGAWSAPLLLLTAVIGPSHERASAVAFYFLALIFNYPHFMATVHRAYHTREEFTKYRIFTVHITLLLAVAAALTHFYFWLLPWVFTLYICWSPWHYSGQNFGLLMMFLRRGEVKVSTGERRALFLTFISSYVMLMISFHTGPSSDPLILSLNISAQASAIGRIFTGALFLVLGGFAFARFVQRSGVRPLIAPATLLLTQGLWFVAPTALEIFSSTQVPQTRYSSGILAILHSAQYIWITTYYVRRESRASGNRAWRLSSYFAILVAGGIGLFIAGPWLISSTFRFDFSTSLLIFTALVNIHHFILDGAIWKLRDSRIATFLLGRSGLQPSETPQAVAASSWFSRSIRNARWVRVAVATGLFLLGGLELIRFYLATNEGNLTQLTRAARLVPHDSSVQMRLARSASRNGDIELAIEALTRAVASNPKNPQPQHARARLLLESRRFQDAYDHYRQMLALFPRDPDALVSFGLVAAQLGHADEALDGWRRAIEIDPVQLNAELYLAGALDRRGERAAAASHYEAFLRLANLPQNETRISPDQRITAHIKLADACAATNQFSRAESALQSALAQARNSGSLKLESLAHSHLAEILEKRGEISEAGRSWQRGLAIHARVDEPHDAAIDWFNYGQFLARQGAPARLVFACFLQAESLLSRAVNTSSSQELETILRFRRETESRLGPTAATIRKNLATVLSEAISLPVDQLETKK